VTSRNWLVRGTFPATEYEVLATESFFFFFRGRQCRSDHGLQVVRGDGAV
jgi:hypothetical protein